MKVRFLTPAILELDEAVQYYDHQFPGLGYRFFQEEIIITAVASLHRNPEHYRKRIK